MRHPLLVPALALVGGLVLACDDGVPADPGDPVVAAVRGDCLAPMELSAVPAPVGGDWWTEGDRPPTLRIVQDGTRLQGDLAFSGVMRAGGTGTLDGGCLRLTFPARAGTGEPALTVDARLLSGGILDVVVGGVPDPLRVTMRRPRPGR
ncbi:hypothetical protein PYV61_12920 [Roseisolibacter sp. H3M3-2]|nr:hypothetical protein [Roseisolibacter sp. H3M3-2]